MIFLQILWYGHSCFLIKNSYGKRILTDPFHIDIGYSPYNGTVDVATISHSHFDHCNTNSLSNETKIINSCGSYNLDFVNVISYPSFHDNCGGKKRGSNSIFVYEVDGIRLCHLGDLGHSLDKTFIDSLGVINVLFIPVGGNYTINAKEAAHITNLIKPNYVIPMHYKTPYLSFFLDGVEKYLICLKKLTKQKLRSLDIDSSTLPSCTQVILLEPKI